MCVQRLITPWVECAGVKVEMSRACCCTVSHADVISTIMAIQAGDDAMAFARHFGHHDIVSVFEQVVGECGGECGDECDECDGMCVCVVREYGGLCDGMCSSR